METPVQEPGSSVLGQIGRRRFIVGTAAGTGVMVAGLPSIARASVPSSATRFVPLPSQVRLADTRDAGRYPFARISGGIRVKVGGRASVPADASSAVLAVTAVNGQQRNFVTVSPSGKPVPTASNLNMFNPGQVTANLVTVRLGDNGSVDVTSRVSAQLIVDVIGYYERVSGPVRAGRFIPLDEARRVLDTRNGGRPQAGSSVVVDVSSVVPPDATSVVVNLTTTETRANGYFTCYALGIASPPNTSNLNVNGPGETRAVAAIVAIGSSGGRRGFRVFTSGGGQIIVDVSGYFTGPDSPESIEGLFVPVDPNRILDTRGKVRGKLWPGWVTGAAIPGRGGTEAGAVAVNVTAVETRERGYFTVFPSGGPIREVSNMNASGIDQIIPNFVMSRISTNGLSIYSYAGAHVLFDLAGWFTGTPVAPQFGYTNPPPPAVGPPWLLEVPNLRLRDGRRGLVSQVLAGSAVPIVDAGHTWHWGGTGFLGQQANIGLFAHRTDAGGPLYHMHELRVGDEIYVRVANRSNDRRRFRYRVVREDMVDNVRYSTVPSVQKILAATRRHPGTTISLIGCTRLDRLPTDLDHRLILTAELVDWIEL